MKRLIYMPFISCLLCCTSKKEEKQWTLEGSYTSFAQGEFSKSWDTIIIRLFQPGAATYTIEHHSGYHRIKKGLLQPKEFKKEKLVGVLDAERGQLIEQKKGKVYTFSSAGDELILGSARYARIN